MKGFLFAVASAATILLGGCAKSDGGEKTASASKVWPGEKLFQDNCLACHGGASPKAPSQYTLRQMMPGLILDALNTGVMKENAAHLKPAERQQIAEYLTKTDLADYTPPPGAKMCEGAKQAFPLDKPLVKVGWGYDNRRLIPGDIAGIKKEDLPRLKVKWAFGYPGAIQARSQPVIAMDTIFVGSQDGTVYALDLETGCARWTAKAGAEVRTTIVVEPGTKSPMLFFGDVLGNAHALDALTGREIWKVHVDSHNDSTVTGTPVPFGDLVYVPVSSTEVGAAENPKYACCTFRGSVVAVDRKTGQKRWQAYTIEQAPRPTGKKTKVGTDILAASGAPVWGSPTVDAKRGLLYFASGENYTSPADKNSDAVFAVDLKTGKRKWSQQLTPNDAWNNSCMYDKGNHPNCPEQKGPDSDISASVLLLDVGGGRQVLVAGAKSGKVTALDPDDGGRKMWETRVGRGSLQGGIHFGMAAEGSLLYVPMYDSKDTPWGGIYDDKGLPGVHGLDARTGKILWRDTSKSQCNGRKSCEPGVSAALTAIPGAVIAGHLDGWLRAYDGATGKIIWQEDTAREFSTVNGGKATGGSMSGPGPVLYNGYMVLNSGYGFARKMPGNVLLVYALDAK